MIGFIISCLIVDWWFKKILNHLLLFIFFWDYFWEITLDYWELSIWVEIPFICTFTIPFGVLEILTALEKIFTSFSYTFVVGLLVFIQVFEILVGYYVFLELQGDSIGSSRIHNTLIYVLLPLSDFSCWKGSHLSGDVEEVLPDLMGLVEIAVVFIATKVVRVGVGRVWLSCGRTIDGQK